VEREAVTKSEKAKDARLRKFFRIGLATAQQVRNYQEWNPDFQVLLAKDGKRESFDHRHSDGLLRGWLAVMLNKAYGMIERLYPDNTAEVLRALAFYHENPPAVHMLGPRYGILGLARKKQKMVYGSAQGPLPAEKKPRKKRRKVIRRPYVVNMSKGDGPIGNTD
jgi:hypothetical protein